MAGGMAITGSNRWCCGGGHWQAVTGRLEEQNQQRNRTTVILRMRVSSGMSLFMSESWGRKRQKVQVPKDGSSGMVGTCAGREKVQCVCVAGGMPRVYAARWQG